VAVPSRVIGSAPLRVSSTARSTLGLCCRLRSFCVLGWLKIRKLIAVPEEPDRYGVGAPVGA